MTMVRSNEAALRENRAAPALLYQIAKQFLRKLLQFQRRRTEGHRDLTAPGRPWSVVDATLQGLRGTIDREDVPNIDEILALGEKSRMHYRRTGLSCGPGGVERNGTGRPIPVGRRPDSQGGRVLLLYGPRAGLSGKWYRRLLEARPEIVADVQVRCRFRVPRRPREYIQTLGTRTRPAPRSGRSARELAPTPRLSDSLQAEAHQSIGSSAVGCTSTRRQSVVSRTDRKEAVPDEHERRSARALVGGGRHCFAGRRSRIA